MHVDDWRSPVIRLVLGVLAGSPAGVRRGEAPGSAWSRCARPTRVSLRRSPCSSRSAAAPTPRRLPGQQRRRQADQEGRSRAREAEEQRGRRLEDPRRRGDWRRRQGVDARQGPGGLVADDARARPRRRLSTAWSIARRPARRAWRTAAPPLPAIPARAWSAVASGWTTPIRHRRGLLPGRRQRGLDGARRQLRRSARSSASPSTRSASGHDRGLGGGPVAVSATQDDAWRWPPARRRRPPGPPRCPGGR